MYVEKSITVEIDTTGSVFATRTVEEIVRLILNYMRGVELIYLIGGMKKEKFSLKEG